jgi:Family of unknown function (DUF5808)
VSKAKVLIGFAAAGLLAAAVATEFRKPTADRTWHGSVAGIVPYDLRPPTVERTWSRVWNPDDDRILTPHFFGVGWTVNVGRIARKLGVV